VMRLDLAEVSDQRLPRELGDRAGELHPRRSAADHHEAEHRRAILRVRGVLGFLERQEDAAPDISGILDLLQTRRDRLPLVVTEIGVPRAGRDDQPVVRHAALGPRVRSGDLDLARACIDAGHAAEQDGCSALAPQDAADRLRDVGWRKGGRRDLVEKRLEQMVVAPVDQGDLHLLLAERHGRAEAAESRADDHHAGHLAAHRRRRSG
jgi:hypothetical protein